MTLYYFCVKCNKFMKDGEDVYHEIQTGESASFFICDICFNKWVEERTKDLNISEVKP